MGGFIDLCSDSAISSIAGGNTITPAKKKTKQISPAKRWCFTFNNYEESDISSIVPILETNCKFGIFSKEVGKKNGTPHLQGYCEFVNKIRPSSLGLSKKIHFEKSLGNRQQNVDYCSKDCDVVWSKGLPKPIKVIENLYSWQKAILEIYKEPVDDRKVYWYWSERGNIGKSAFIKYMIVKHKILFCSGGKYTDIMNLVFNQNMDECNCIMFDIPRANRGCISYASLESIKNGMVCNTKYETGVKVFNSPHVFVFANFKPDDMEQLSPDRWVITEL